MRLLITTQAVDLDDPVLAFFHRWLEEFSKGVDHVEVICLKEGRHELPKNVSVHSLEKEKGESNLKYVRLFYHYAWGLRNRYDSVFVHMNPEYLVIFGWVWKLLGKRTSLWYIHPRSSWRLQIGQMFADVIFSATEKSFPLKTPKLMPVGLGVDTEFFRPLKEKSHGGNSLRVMCVARIAPVKNVETIIDAVKELFRRRKPIAFDFYGEELPRDAEYAAQMRKKVEEPLGWNFPGKASIEDIRFAYQTHDVHVNATDSGSFDKAVFESMACGTITVVSNTALEGLVPKKLMFREKDPISLADTLEHIMSMSEFERKALGATLRNIAEEKYSLSTLIMRIIEKLS